MPCLWSPSASPLGSVLRVGVATRDSDDGDLPVLKSVQVDDQIDFRQVVEQLHGRVVSVCYALLGNASEADVVAQKVFVRLYRTVRPGARRRDFLKCAYRLAIDQCLVELRMRHVRKLFPWLTRSMPIPERNRLPAADESSDRLLAVRCLSMLPERQRALLVLKEVAGEPVEQIAAIMNMDSGAVRAHLFSARQKLRTILAAGGAEQANSS